MRNSIIVVISLVALTTVTVAPSCDHSNKLIVSNEKTTFFDAYVRCRQNGFNPVEIITQEDEIQIEDALKNVTDYGWDYGFWIFATNLGDIKNYYWLDSGKPLIYSHFGFSQPNNPQSGMCLEIAKTNDKVFQWHDMPCSLKLRFICKYPTM